MPFSLDRKTEALFRFLWHDLSFLPAQGLGLPIIGLYFAAFYWLLIVCCVTSRSKVLHLYGNVIVNFEELQIIFLSREVSLSCHTWCDTGLRFCSLIRRQTHLAPLYDKQRVHRTFSNSHELLFTGIVLIFPR